jgi:aspartate/methionine/tyrosine aminotransferase
MQTFNSASEPLWLTHPPQYSPTKGRPRLKKAIADSYSKFWGRQLNPETEVTITTGANEGMTFMQNDLSREDTDWPRHAERLHGLH